MLVQEDEIHIVIDRASDIANSDSGTRYPGMTYEQGIADGLSWALSGEDNPMED